MRDTPHYGTGLANDAFGGGGGFAVTLAWEAGRLTEANQTATAGGHCTIRNADMRYFIDDRQAPCRVRPHAPRLPAG